jgi:hypothetical protein
MKATRLALILVCCLLCSLNEFGQIINSSNSWNYLAIGIRTCEKCDGKFYENYHYSITGDTNINDKEYSKLIESVIMQNDSVPQTNIAGFLRDEDNHKKIYYLANQSGVLEVLLYDFTIKKDTIFKVGFFNSKVINIDSILVYNTKRLRIKFDKTKLNWISDIPVADTVEWIEGIGSSQGLINYQESEFFNLLCFKQNNAIVYSNDYKLDCSYSGPLDFIKSQKIVELDVYPSPAKDIINIQSKNLIYNVTLYGLSGEKLLQNFPKDTHCEIIVTNFKRGMYIIDIDNNYKKIIKE